MEVDVGFVLGRRRAERAALLERAGTFAADLPDHLEVRAVVVFGSVARGDFNQWSDIDVLVVADQLPERFLDRHGALGPPVPPVQPFAWTVPEWHRQVGRRNPIAVEALERGIWLVGDPNVLSGSEVGQHGLGGPTP